MKVYRAIAKVGDDKFVKYRTVRNLISFATFLDENFSDWRYFNVFDKNTDQQIASYTKHKRPTTEVI